MKKSAVSITLEEDDEDPFSPVDDLDGTVRKPHNVLFESSKKDEYEPLDSRIASERSQFLALHNKLIYFFAGLFYINAYGNEIHPSPNQDYVLNLAKNDVLVYSCGSLWTR